MNNSSTLTGSKAVERQVYLATMPFAKDDTTRSWLHITVVCILIAGAYLNLVVNSNIVMLCCTSLLLSLLQVRFFVIYHDYAHRTILKMSFIARMLFTVFGWYILAPLDIWRRSHNHHHHHNSKLNLPAIGEYQVITKRAYLKRSRAGRFAYLLQRHPLTILFGYFFTFLYGMCLRNAFLNFRRHPDAIVALVFHLTAGYLLYSIGGPKIFILGFFAPAFISCSIGSYLFYVQHNYPGVVHFQRGNWSNFNAALNSSGYLGMHPVMEWFTGAIGFHHVHHLNSAIPFYNLRRAHESIPGLKKEKDTSLRLRDIIRCMKLKVWDEGAQRMTAV